MEATRERLALKAKFFRGLADRSRLGILESLRDGARNVGEIVAATGLTQSNASMHLECLYCCGLVRRERRGRFIYYRLRSPRTLRLLEAAGKALDEVESHIQECARYED
ncbi:MAG: winged helix-turn-helix transcriptional regulator [Planctomycetes bacterium]|nr:winged helix-turn-helix transcriptional regulator [Planctomycetota bacterium]